LLKEHLFPAFETLNTCIEMATLMLSNIAVKENIMTDEKYKYAFSVEEVNKLVLQGMPFRDAYKKVGLEIEAGKFDYSTQINHTHEGTIGNLCNDKIEAMMQQNLAEFGFDEVHTAIDKLLS
jgi:argininosuccinate lyase